MSRRISNQIIRFLFAVMIFNVILLVGIQIGMAVEKQRVDIDQMQDEVVLRNEIADLRTREINCLQAYTEQQRRWTMLGLDRRYSYDG